MGYKKNDLYAVVIRYNCNEFPSEIFFLKLCYDGGNITFEIDKNNYRVSVEDYKLGSFDLINKNINNSNFSQQVGKILSELGNLVGLEYIGNSMNLDYIKAFSKVRINGEEIKVDNDKMINLIDKLFHTTLSYVKNNFSSYHFPLNFNRIIIYYTYIVRNPLFPIYFDKNPSLDGYWAYTPEYIYAVSYTSDSFIIYKTQDNNEPKEAFRIDIGIYKYSQRILYKVINLVLQSKIKADSYEIDIEGKNVTINNKPVKVEDKLVNDITDLIKNQIEYIINTVKNKLNMLA
jgi:hypothetical protein